MEKLSFYEQAAIVTPGAFVLFGVVFFVPELKTFFVKDGLGVGDLGIFVLICYPIGHMLAQFGSMMARVYWRFQGGMPSDWVIGPKPRLLNAAQIKRLEALIKTRLKLELGPLREVQRAAWFPVFRLIYSDIDAHGKPSRAETFNGNYGLAQGFLAAAPVLGLFILARAPAQWGLAGALMLLTPVFLARLHNFGVNYAREVFDQFLLLEEKG